MTEIRNIKPAEQEEISLRELILKIKDWIVYLRSKWLIITIAGILGGVLGFVYASIKKPVYTAECTFVLEEGDGGGGIGQLAGLASMVGVNIGGDGGGLFKGDNIIELYKSRTMIEKTLLSEAVFNNKNQLLIDRFIQSNKLRERWSKDEELQNISFPADHSKYTLKQDSLLGKIVEDINKNYLEVAKPDKKLSIISVKVKSKDELFAKAFTDKIVANVNQFYVDTKTKKSAENLSILQKQADSVKRELNASISGVASANQAVPNANPLLEVLRVPSQRRQVDAQANAAIYTEVVKNLEIAKMTYRREMPLIQVVDKPVLPLEMDSYNKFKSAILMLLFFSLLTSVILLINRIIKGLMI